MWWLLSTNGDQVKKENWLKTFCKAIRKFIPTDWQCGFESPAPKNTGARTNRRSFGEDAKIKVAEKAWGAKAERIWRQKKWSKAKILIKEGVDWKIVQGEVREIKDTIWTGNWSLEETKHRKDVSTGEGTAEKEGGWNQNVWEADQVKRGEVTWIKNQEAQGKIGKALSTEERRNQESNVKEIKGWKEGGRRCL